MLQQLEEPIHPRQKKQVVEAIRASGLRVSPGQVAEAANLPVLVAAQELNRIAGETGAHLDVTEAGAVIYAFSPQFEQAYSLAGPKKLLRRCARILTNALLILVKTAIFAGIFLLRISFGLMLLASVVALVIAAVAAVLAVLKSADGFDGIGGDSSSGSSDLNLSGLSDGFASDGYSSQWTLSYWCFDWLWDWIFFPRYMWGPSYYSYGWFNTYNDYDYGRVSYNPDNFFDKPDTRANDASKKKPRTKFLDSCFLLLFGAGDPNQQIEQKRWQDIVKTIKLNFGVVVAEQLAPYMAGEQQNEDWMLPILLRFNGLPEVTEKGQIVYLFPQFMNLPAEQSSALTVKSSEAASAPTESSDQLRALYAGHLNRQKIIKTNVESKNHLENYLVENKIDLLPTSGEYESVFIFVGLAIVLSLGNLYFSGSVELLHNLRPLFYGILGYTSLFFILPGIRSVMNYFTNQNIDNRNNKRLEASAHVLNPSKQISEKLQDARAIAFASMNENDNRIVYTTEQDLLQQQFEAPSSSKVNLQNLRSL